MEINELLSVTTFKIKSSYHFRLITHDKNSICVGWLRQGKPNNIVVGVGFHFVAPNLRLLWLIDQT